LRVFTRENRIVNVFGDFDSPISGGHLCARGRYETWTEARPRLEQPMIRANGKLSPATWEEAARVITGAIKKAKTDERALLVSPRLTNEAVQSVQALGKKFGRVGVFVGRNEAALWAATSGSNADSEKLREADAIIVLGAHPTRTHGVIAAGIRVAARRRGAKLFILHAPKSGLDRYATVCANIVSMERHFWKRMSDELQTVKHPVLVYGPNAMTAIGVTVLERLTKILESNQSGGTLQLMALPAGTNSHALKAAGIQPVEAFEPWLEAKPPKFLHLVASDEPDGGARWLEDKHLRLLLEYVGFLVVQASHPSALTDLAKVVLPAADWSEKAGTTTNLNGRELPLRAVLPPCGEAREDKAILETIYA
jgi:predicted molibdopterin-dependent oxidoreductase YjgC